MFDDLLTIELDDVPALSGFAPTALEQVEAELDAPTMQHLEADVRHETSC